MRYRVEKFGTATLIHGDALDVLAMLAGRRFSGMLADPPYCSGGNVRDKAVPTSEKYLGRNAPGRYPEFQGDTRDQRSFLAWSTMWMARTRELVIPGGIAAVFSDWRQLPVTSDALQCAGWVWRGIVPWDKTENCRPQRGRYRTQAEFITWGTNGARALGGPVVPGAFRIPVPREKFHITGKPVALMTALLAPMGAAVLDPFAGSATVGVACLELGIEYVGVEVDPTYFDVACHRLAAEHERLGGAPT